MAEYKAGLRANGIRPPKVEAKPVGPEREFRKVPMERLMSRLDLTKYNKEAPLDESEDVYKRQDVEPPENAKMELLLQAAKKESQLECQIGG